MGLSLLGMGEGGSHILCLLFYFILAVILHLLFEYTGTLFITFLVHNHDLFFNPNQLVLVG